MTDAAAVTVTRRFWDRIPALDSHSHPADWPVPPSSISREFQPHSRCGTQHAWLRTPTNGTLFTSSPTKGARSVITIHNPFCVSCVWHGKVEIWICRKERKQRPESPSLSLSLSLSLFLCHSLSPSSLSNVGQIKHVSLHSLCQGQQLKNIPEWTERCFLSRSIFP